MSSRDRHRRYPGGVANESIADWCVNQGFALETRDDKPTCEQCGVVIEGDGNFCSIKCEQNRAIIVALDQDVERLYQSREKRKVVVYVRCGNRFVGEEVDLAEHREHFDEAEFPHGKPSWEQYIRPVRVEGDKALDAINGNHFLFGYVEGLFQSDFNPAMYLDGSFHGSGDTWVYEVRHER